MTMESLGTILQRISARSTWTATDGDTDDYRGRPTTPPDGTTANNCPACGGAGWLASSAPVQHPDFGKLIPCRCQQSDTDRTRRIAALERYSNLGALRRWTFANANPDGPDNAAANRPAFANAFRAAADFAADPRGWLTFAGPSGSGKTYLAAAIANHRIDLGEAALFVTAADLLDYLRGGFDDDSEVGFVDLLDQVRQAPLLALDDLPARPATPWGQERVFQLLAWRHSQRLPTVITLRGDPNRMDEFLQTRMESADGFGHIHRLGRLHSVAGRVMGIISPSMRQRMTFQTFNPDGHGDLSQDERSRLKSVKNYVQRWAHEPDDRWLWLYGPYGVGKTHLAVAAASERETLGDEVFFATVADLLDYLRAAFAPDSPIAHDDLLDRIKTADVLVLDDMGAERSTPFAEDKLFQIVGYRYEERLPTIITTSKFEDIADTRPRIASRLQDPKVVSELLIVAPDYRRGAGCS